MMLASDDVFSSPMKLLPSGGMITRMACGRMMRRNAWPPDMPIDCAASCWPRSTARMPARTISEM